MENIITTTTTTATTSTASTTIPLNYITLGPTTTCRSCQLCIIAVTTPILLLLLPLPLLSLLLLIVLLLPLVLLLLQLLLLLHCLGKPLLDVRDQTPQGTFNTDYFDHAI